MEFICLISGFIGGMLFMRIVMFLTNNPPAETVPVVSEDSPYPSKSVIDKRNAELAEELRLRVEADTERYIVEVTTKTGEVCKTDEFTPEGSYRYTSYSYGDTFYFDQKVYHSSKGFAEGFIHRNQGNHTKLVQFGNDYVCVKSVTKVRLVKVK